MKSVKGYGKKNISMVLLFAVTFFGSWDIDPKHVAYAEETIYVDAYNPPFMYERYNDAAGIYPTLVRAVFSRLGEKVVVNAVPWKRAIAYLDTGEGGVGGIYKTKTRLEKYDYTDEIYSEAIMVYVPKGKAFSLSNVPDLAGKRVGIIRGWSYGEKFDQAKENGLFMTEERHDDANNFNKLIMGRLDALLAIKESAELVIAKKRISDKVEVLPTSLVTNSTHIAFSKKSDKSAVIRRINRAIRVMRQDGSYDKVLNEIISKESIKVD